jgi:hypothetical protein
VASGLPRIAHRPRATKAWVFSTGDSGKETKGPADVKVGDKVTIEYTMTATSVAKSEGAPKK